MIKRMALSLIVGACTMTFADDPSPVPTPARPAERSVQPALPQSVIDQAIAAPLFRCYRNVRGFSGIAGNGGANILLATAAWLGNHSADDALLKRIRYSIEGNNAILCGGGYWSQHERHVTGMFALARLTPRIWDQLTHEEKQKIDLLMTAALVASAYTTSDHTYSNRQTPVTLEGDGNLHRDWNPNYREGMIGMMIVGAVYFGGPAQAHAVLENYDHDAFVAQLKEAGLSNTLDTFTWGSSHPDAGAPDAKEIAESIRNYRYKGMTLDDPMEILYGLTAKTYGANVHAGLNGGKGINGAGCLVSGTENLPNIGKPGMLFEFDSGDAGGPRSSAGYAYGGFRTNLTNHIVLLAGGYWKDDARGHECLDRMSVGIPDLYYKLEHGYRDYSKGKPDPDVFKPLKDWDCEMALALWEKVLRPLHGR